jgi:murein DD-endopeptidase MepM/ murein hydrolase activator NlpD
MLYIIVKNVIVLLIPTIFAQAGGNTALLKEKYVNRRKFLAAGLTGAAALILPSRKAHAYVPAGLLWPIPWPSYLGELYGYGLDWVRDCPVGSPKRHTGIDIRCSVNTPVYATYWGTVKAVGWSDSSNPDLWQKYVTVVHGAAGPNLYGQWWTSTYHHISPTVNVGNWVHRGQIIGYIANISGTDHLHFGIRDYYYSNTSNAGALPRTYCGGYPGFPEYFLNPWSMSYSS